MHELCERGYDVLLETSGSLDISRIDPRVVRIMDIKCPGSGMVARNRYKNIAELTEKDEVKFVINDRHDYEWAKNIMAEHGLADICSILMSPVFGELENIDLAQWILDDGLSVRMQIQMHKYIWDPQKRGV
jgi:7-carboxy-7-deazaguanine synthase